MNIYEKMLEATKRIGVVAKNLNVETGGGRGYKAVSERDVIDAVKPIEAELGIYSYPLMREIVESDMLETETKNGKKTTFYTHLKTVYRFLNTEKPEEFIDITSYSVGMDSGDKGDGKAATYGDKYCLMKAYKISTGDDPDQKASEDSDYTPVKRATPNFPDTFAEPDVSMNPVTEAHVKALFKSCEDKKVSLQTVLDAYGVASAGALNIGQWNNAMKRLEATK